MQRLEPASDFVAESLGPGFIGFLVSVVLYGVTIGQAYFYWYSFPGDLRMIKLLVFAVCIADTMHVIASGQFYWKVLIACHGSYTLDCTTQNPWGIYPALMLHYTTTFAVQGFYSHRVWIISGKNKRISMAILILATAHLVLGLNFASRVFEEKTIEYLNRGPLAAVAAGASTICDIIITGSIVFYLWFRQRRFRRHGNIMQHLLTVFVNTGVLTCLMSLSMVVVYLTQGDSHWIGAPAVVLSRCHVNSLLAVLNARKFIRERQRDRLHVPTLSTIYA